jgi:hypothetical protein
MSELVHNAASIDAEGDDDRGERVAQLVGCQAVRSRHVAGLGQLLIALLDCLVEDAAADVALDQFGAI